MSSQAEVYDLMADTINQWLADHQQTRRRDIPANITQNLLRALADKGYSVIPTHKREYGVADYVVCATCGHWAVAHGMTHPGLVPCDCCGRAEPSWKSPVDNAQDRPVGNAGSCTPDDPVAG